MPSNPYLVQKQFIALIYVYSGHLVDTMGHTIVTIPTTHTHTHTHSVLHRAAQRQDLATVACLIRLGADPLLKNTFNSSTTDMLALKHFPPKNFTPKLEEKGETTNNVLLYYILASLVTEISACVCTGQLFDTSINFCFSYVTSFLPFLPHCRTTV